MKTRLSIAMIMSASAATSGGLSDPIVQPRVSANPPSYTSWSGPFVRLSYGMQRTTREDSITTKTVEQTEVETPVYEECAFDESKGDHSGRKCRDLDYPGNADLNALPHGNWRGCDAPVCAWGYDDAGNVTDIWLEEYKPFSFQTGTVTTPGDPIITRAVDYFTEEFDDEVFGVSIGQRWQRGNIVYGGELTAMSGDAGDMFIGEAQLGYSIASVLPYVSVGHDGGVALWGAGFDIRLSRSLFVGAEYTQGDDVEMVTASIGFAW